MFVVWVSVIFFTLVWALDTCPTAETAYNGRSGSKFAICAGTDLQGNTLQVYGGTASTAACGAICDGDGRCIRAVYDTQTQNCHIKDNGANLNWVADNRFNVIRLNNTLPERTVIASCPYTASSYTSPAGTQFQVCPYTDLRGNSAQVIQNIADLGTCAQRCGSTNGCRAAVYDNINKVCHIKDMADDATLVWATNKQFSVVQTIRTYSPATYGKWTDLVRLPLIPVAVYIVPEYPSASRLLAFSAEGDFKFGAALGYTQFTDYNYNTGAVSHRTVANTQHNMFCPGISALQDGRIMITGGNDAAVTSFYNPSTNDFARGPDMKIARGYQTSATLSNGKVFTIGGSYSGGIQGQNGVPYKNGEVYDPATNTWTLLNGANVQPMLTVDAGGAWRTDNHGWLFGWRNGSVFQAGPSRKQHWYGTDGTGSVVDAGVRPDAVDQMCGVNVMYDIGKILSAGGSPDYTDSDATKMAHITTIDKVGAASQVERIADMNWPRGLGNGVVLPDGTVLLIGGQKRSIVFTDTDGVLAPELFNPSTKTWSKMAPEAAPRNYHSAAVLLADARVWSGGGGLCWATGNCDVNADHPDGQIFSPPYLFKSDGSAATRPVISKLSSTTAKVGRQIIITMSNSNAVSFSLIRMGSSTHSINSDQRRVPLSATRSGATSTATLPNDSGVLIPGHYHLFAISGGVPSVARTVRVTL